MKNLVMMVLSMLIVCYAVTAIADDFRKIYNQIEVGERLSDEFVLNHFGFKIVNEPMAWTVWKVKEKPKIPESKSLVLLVEVENAVGGEEFLFSLDENGTLIDSMRLTNFAHWDGGFNDSTDYLRCDNNIFLIKNSSIDYFGGGFIGKFDTHIYRLVENGKIVKNDKLMCAKYRKYGELSEYLLTMDALSGKSSEDTRIMRNEIFAAHGYIFNDPKQSLYFKQMDWYRPESKDVSSSLNNVEKKNVQTLLDYEKNIHAKK
jgi:hypothetical protein